MGLTYSMLNFNLGEDIDMLRQSVRHFVDEKLMPIADEIDKEDRFPRELWRPMGELGLFGVFVDEKWGGVNLGYMAHAVILEELSRASASVGLSYAAHTTLCLHQLLRWGNEAQLKKYLPALLSGEHVGALAMSEANAGSDVVSMKLRADKKGNKYILNGTKMWITNGPCADTLIVYAKTEPEAGSKGMSTFIVEKDFPGFSVAQKLDKLGHRGSETGELVFENCEVPEENLLGDLNAGVKILMSGLDIERSTLTTWSLGIMQACLDTVLPYVHQREQFGKSIGEFQLVQGKLADMYTKLNATRAYAYAVNQANDRNEISRKDAAAAFLFSAENGTQVALDAIQLMGGNGYINENPVGRFLRDAKLAEIGGGTSEIRRMLIARELLAETK